MITNTAILDFGAFPGTTDSSLFISDATIVSGALVDAWITPIATIDHSIDEHLADPPRIIAANVVPGSGFTIYGFGRKSRYHLLAGAADQPLVYGKWTVTWVWHYAAYVDNAPVQVAVAPAITGVAYSGNVLTCDGGTWVGTNPISYAYQWYRDGVLASGQTGSTYTITDALGVVLTCKVTGTNTYGTQTSTSNSKTVVARAPVGTTSVLFNFQGSDLTQITTDVNGHSWTWNNMWIRTDVYAPGAATPYVNPSGGTPTGNYIYNLIGTLDMGTGDGCLEIDCMLMSTYPTGRIPLVTSDDLPDTHGWTLGLSRDALTNARGGFTFSMLGTVIIQSPNSVTSYFTDNTFHRFAMVRQSGVMALFVDGIFQNSVTDATDIVNVDGFSIANWASDSTHLGAQIRIRAVRFTVQASRYNAYGNHTPDPLPLTF